MNQNWLIISYAPLASSLQRYLHTFYRKPVEIIVLPRRFFDEDIYYNVTNYNMYYEAISQKLCSYSPSELRRLVVIFTKWVDEIGDSSLWDPLHRHARERKQVHPQEILLSWLILSFPEVRWVFFHGNSDTDRVGSPSTAVSAEVISLDNEFHYLTPDLAINSEQLYPGYVSLFDPTGIRNRLRNKLRKTKDDGEQEALSDVPLRQLTAGAIDEESAYAYMNTYIAYRFGYRGWALKDWQMTEKVLGENGPGAHLIFEDLYLNFHDRPLNFGEEQKFHSCVVQFNELEDRHISHLAFRDCLLPKLKDVKERILLTVGHRKWQADKERWAKNKHYFLTLMTTRVKTLYKPFTGIFDLWEKAGKCRRFRRRPQCAQGFCWPPGRSGPSLASGGHSAPGQLLVLAHCLLDRAQNILRQAETVPEAIHAALLALEAKELLANKTPTTALRALAIQHGAEITAESMFYGIEYNLNVKERFQDIAREVQSISRWFNPSSRKRSELNARLTIVETLARRFRDLNQFEEEQQCLAEARKLQFGFWMRQKPWRKLAFPFLKYLEHALYSLPRFFFILFLWIVFFGLIYYFVGDVLESNTAATGFWDSISSSTMFFFTMQSAPNWTEFSRWAVIWNFIMAVQGLVSLFNLTLLLANLYLLVSRR